VYYHTTYPRAESRKGGKSVVVLEMVEEALGEQCRTAEARRSRKKVSAHLCAAALRCAGTA
jgi:hypothetical protein